MGHRRLPILRDLFLPNSLRVLAEKHSDVGVLNKAQADACMSQSRDGRRVAVLRMIRRSKDVMSYPAGIISGCNGI